MGLCKCPKKKVTSQFCFEHKVNVCEYCMIDGAHKTCIVGPYLNWLENSGFDTKCHLCRSELNTSDCIRLCCYHILHLQCLNNYANQFPPNTAPAGYTCPICSTPIFSINSKTSPVASRLEFLLAPMPWAKECIGLNATTPDNFHSTGLNHQESKNYSSLLNNDSTKINMPPTSADNHFTPKILHNSINNKMNLNYSAPINVSNVTSYISTNSDLSFGSTSSMRSKFDNESRRSLLSSVDEIAEDKYRTKSPIEFFSRWLRTRTTYVRNQSAMSSLNVYKKIIIYGFIAFLFLFILIHYFIKYGRQSAENDPFLKPENDPNIRNEND